MHPGATRRTILLTERRPRDCRLSTADVAFLLAEHAGPIEVLPTGLRGRYRLTARGHAGSIVAPTCRLVIRPKIPLRSLFHLLDPLGPVSVFEDSPSTLPGTEALDFLAGRLAQLLAERAAAGLHRAYAERTEQGPFLHGRLDLPAQLRDGSGRKNRLHCRYEEFTVDVPCNQVPRATAELLLRSPLLSEAVRAALRRSLQGFAGVQAVPLQDNRFAAAASTDRLTEAYRSLLDLCRLLADCLHPGERSGALAYPSFLLDMERLFERYVTAGVVTACAGEERCGVAVQPVYVPHPPNPGQPDLTMQADLIVSCGERRLVIDAKWKRLTGTLVTPDVHQVLAYAAALGARRAALVYPGRRDRAWSYALTGTGLVLDVYTLRVIGEREACVHSLRCLGRRLRRLAEEEDAAKADTLA